MAGHRSIGCIPPREPQFVSISLSSGFSFQVLVRVYGASRSLFVSISLSSGFSFQVDIQQDIAVINFVSISLSSGFSFQVG